MVGTSTKTSGGMTLTLIKRCCRCNTVGSWQMALQEGNERSALLGLADGLAVP